MATTRRRVLIVLSVVAGLLLACVLAAGLWLWRPAPGALAEAASVGDLDRVRRYLRRGADPDEPMRWGWHDALGPTPLTAAAEYGHVDVVRVLLAAGADPNLRDFGPDTPHDTPLATAAMHGQLEVCRVLLQAGADPNAPSQNGWTALDWALQAEQHEVADLLRQHGGMEGGRTER